MAGINHEIKINADPKKVFDALTTLSGLSAWHTAIIDGDTSLHGIMVFEAADKPTFRWRVDELEPNRRVVWECVEGPGDSVGTKAIYNLSKEDDGQTLVELEHSKWPHDKGNFRKCNTLWAILLYHLKSYVESDKKNPALN